MKSQIFQRTVQLISLVVLCILFWNYYKLRNPITHSKVEKIEMTAFEKGLGCKCDQEFVETPEMIVVRVLPDDAEDVPHQKWIIQAPSGHTLLFTNNLKLCQRLTIKKGVRVHLGGEFRWTEKGGLIHWTHADPFKIRRDGYVRIENKNYCQTPILVQRKEP